MFQFPGFASCTYEFSAGYSRSCGFPHSEIHGSKRIRSSPRLIAAYHVLHRLLAPRHPPNALKTLDYSHYQYPPVLRKFRLAVQTNPTWILMFDQYPTPRQRLPSGKIGAEYGYRSEKTRSSGIHPKALRSSRACVHTPPYGDVRANPLYTMSMKRSHPGG